MDATTILTTCILVSLFILLRSNSSRLHLLGYICIVEEILLYSWRKKGPGVYGKLSRQVQLNYSKYKCMKDFYEWLLRYFSRGTQPIHFYLGNRDAYLVYDPKHISQIFTDKHFSEGMTSMGIRKFGQILPDALVAFPHEVWLHSRPRYIEELTGEKLKESRRYMVRHLQDAVNKWNLMLQNHETYLNFSHDIFIVIARIAFELVLGPCSLTHHEEMQQNHGEISERATRREVSELRSGSSSRVLEEIPHDEMSEDTSTEGKGRLTSCDEVPEDICLTLLTIFDHIRANFVSSAPVEQSNKYTRDKATLVNYISKYIDIASTRCTMGGSIIRSRTTLQNRDILIKRLLSNQTALGISLNEDVIEQAFSLFKPGPVHNIHEVSSVLVKNVHGKTSREGIQHVHQTDSYEDSALDTSKHSKTELEYKLSCLFCEGGTIDRERSINECLSVIAAATETTAIAATWCIYFLAKYPDIQERLYNEVRGANLTSFNMSDYKYLRAVVLETLRYIPPTLMFNREVLHTITLDGITLPVNSLIFGCRYFTHRLPNIWGDTPDTFDPSHFLNREVLPGEFIPFNEGSIRFCPGAQFSRIEMATIAAAMCQKYTFSLTLSTPVQVDYTITLRPIQPVYITLKAR